VVNIGLGIKQVAVEPRDVSVPQYVESLSHKVRATRFFLFFTPRGCGIGLRPPHSIPTSTY
jgi:4'-phosphopantetheinyl transferase